MDLKIVRNITLMLCMCWAASACERYRYPCQDPDNWETKECKKPYCTATGTCPDQLMKPEETNEPTKADKPIPCTNAGTARCGN